MSKVLIVGPSWLGDMIMAHALFKILYQQGKTIDVLAPKWNHGILNCMPEVNQAIEMPFDHGELKFFARYQFAKTLQKKGYSECIVIPNSFKSALIPYWAKIPKRTGWLGESRYLLLNNTHKLNETILPLMVQRLVALAYLENNVKQEDIASISYPYPELKIDNNLVATTLEKFGLTNNNKILLLAPGAAFGEAKKWPADYFAAIAKHKIKQGWQVWLLGSLKDKLATDAVDLATANQCVNLAGRLALPETVALISRAQCVVSNDSGLLHVAAALNIPLIGIYGSTSPDFTPPLIKQDKKAMLSVDNLACRPCFQQTCKYQHYKCLYDIKPDVVINTMDRLMS
jgi:heptosyltransferase-2